LFNPDTSHAQPQCLGRQSQYQNAVQFSPVDTNIWFIDMSIGCSKFSGLQDFPGGTPKFCASKDGTSLNYLISKTKLAERPNRICPNGQSRADALKRLGSFIHSDIDSNLLEGYCSTQPPYPATDNDRLFNCA
jgi:hypothetical protein